MDKRYGPDRKVLEFHVVDHCNLKCKGCAHFSNIATPRFANLKELNEYTYLNKYFNTLRLLGGEPLLHPQLKEFIDLGVEHFEYVELVTNGLLLYRMPPLFFDYISERNVHVHVTAYEVRKVACPVGDAVVMTSPVEWHHVGIDESGSQDGEKMWKECRQANTCFNLHDGRIWPCATAAYAPLKDLTSSVLAEEYDGQPFKPINFCKFCEPQVPAEWDRHRNNA